MRETREVRRLDQPLATFGALGVKRHPDPAMVNGDPAAGDHHPNPLPDQPPGDAVGVGVDLDSAVGLYAPDQVAELPEGRAPVDGPKRGGFLAVEPHDRRLAGRAMRPHIGDLTYPPGQVAFQRRPTFEGVPSDGVALHIADGPARPCPLCGPDRARRPGA